MKLIVDFEKRKEGALANESWDIPNELMPLISAYAWKPKKGDAVMDFIAELSECETECEFTCDDANVKCMAAAGTGRGIVLIANLSKSSVPLKDGRGSGTNNTVKRYRRGGLGRFVPSVRWLRLEF